MSYSARKSLLNKLEDIRTTPNNIVLNAFRNVPRENFVLPNSVIDAYEDRPLSIGFSQTISQPSTVFAMVEALEVQKTDKVLEVGSGSGYQAAIISQLSNHVYSLEIIPGLVDFATSNLAKTNIKNVDVILWDGSTGYKNEAPFDKIIVSAGNDKIPDALIDQLKEGGILIAPIGNPDSQKMIKATINNHVITETDLGAYIFVPLTGKYGRKTSRAFL